MTILFWASLALVAFAYAGYPLLMALLARVRPRPVRTGHALPTIDVLLVVHNGMRELPAKLDNLLALDYPPDRLRINVACDGCTDGSDRFAAQRDTARIRVFAFAERRGKSACLGNVVPLLDAEIVLFNDVRQRIDPGAARALVAALADPTVGAASGELVLQAREGYGQGVDAYWRYEKAIRRLESASGSLVGATGALYAARRSLIPEIPPGIVLDDMWIPLGIAASGHRTVFVPAALAFDRTSDNPVDEERRKRRTLAGNFQLIHLRPALAIPGAHPLAWRLWGHKWLRLLAPWLLALALLANAILALRGGVLYPLLFALQLIAYATAVMGRGWPRLATLLPVRLATAFLSLNTSAMLALADYLRDPEAHLWQTTRLEDAHR
ncbi:glycosyltransferase family 2 protein [Pseudoxanthomonas sp.]|jgi:cellulose synthase/poly-beta-1,6-N-acetylglucosamine synthase-like glycosyltransferase|uniref:glycosyltransferase family 2 protein n=1 Tax=Pseudoxanthomonas sp. TaxID=1871049 RepID=UPI002E11BD0C|nr:glycosyltransferase family 2 protein [Pseudoxanthomonas sp.]